LVRSAVRHLRRFFDFSPLTPSLTVFWGIALFRLLGALDVLLSVPFGIALGSPEAFLLVLGGASYLIYISYVLQVFEGERLKRGVS
jgi:hypothetical protein